MGGPDDGVPVLYFHGASATPDCGPSDDLCFRDGIRLIRFCRPGYGNIPARPTASLIDIAESALSQIADLGLHRVSVLGWSGGGSYALASALAPTKIVDKVAIVASWAPMQPPHPNLPGGVKLFMKAAQVLPRTLFRSPLVATGRRTVGHADDIRRVARPWGFEVDGLPAHVPVAAWHSTGDHSVPVEPWRNCARISLDESPGEWHEPHDETWAAIFDWVTARPPR